MDDSLKGAIRALKWIEEEAKRLGIVVNEPTKKKIRVYLFKRKAKF